MSEMDEMTSYLLYSLVSMPIEIEVHTVPHFKAPFNSKAGLPKCRSEDSSILALLRGKILL